MKISCMHNGGNSPDCEIEHLIDEFEFSQGGQTITCSGEQAKRLAAIIATVEEQARLIVQEQSEKFEFSDTDIPGDVAFSPKKVSLVPAEGRLAFALVIQDENGSVSLDVDELWGLRTFVLEAVRQEQADGVYSGWA